MVGSALGIATDSQGTPTHKGRHQGLGPHAAGGRPPRRRHHAVRPASIAPCMTTLCPPRPRWMQRQHDRSRPRGNGDASRACGELGRGTASRPGAHGTQRRPCLLTPDGRVNSLIQTTHLLIRDHRYEPFECVVVAAHASSNQHLPLAAGPHLFVPFV